MGKEQKTQTVRRLTCTLTEEEYRTKSEELTKLLREKASHEAQKSASAKYYKELIDGDEHAIEDVLPVVETGTEERDVKCEIVWNTPEKGLKVITRLDTMEKIATEEMTADECQDLFLNHEDASDQSDEPDEKPEPVVLKALPPPEPEALPAPADEVIDAEIVEKAKEPDDVSEDRSVIHVNPNTAALPVVLEAGKWYELNGVNYIAEPRPEHSEPCDGCVFDGKSGPATCGRIDCDKNDVRLIPNDGKPRTCSECRKFQKWPPNVVKERGSFHVGECPGCYGLIRDEKQAMNCPKFERFTPLAKCSKCGHNPGTLYHVSNEKVLCEHCMEHSDGMKKAVKFLDEKSAGAAFEYRAQFGYGCTTEYQETTCFRINQKPGGYASWGMNHYKIGDYQTPGTPAYEWAVHLNNIGGIEA